LKKAYSNSLNKYREEAEYKDFYEKNRFWLEDYSLFMAVKESFDNLEWLKWPDDIRLRNPEAVEKYRKKLEDEIGFWNFSQYKFIIQWEKLRKYANQNGISIIGDIPMYVAMDSVDSWVNFKEFQMDENHRPTRVAGVPPDRFSKTGQLWGNPLFNWDYMVKNNFSWWRNRMKHAARLYHIIRIDHFIGIIRYYSIPIGAESAVNGIYRPGPGIDLLKAINEEIGDSKIIAEDLGVVTEDVKKILKKTGYPGMKILIFAFDGKSDNPNLPVHLKKNSVIYGGTHDNDTLRGFVSSCDEEVNVCIRKHFEVKENVEMVKKIMEAGFNSRANVAIFQMQDYLMLGNETKTNTPSTMGDNWQWRLIKEQASLELAGVIRNMKKER
jgi:4-alpha-glucanotransferase